MTEVGKNNENILVIKRHLTFAIGQFPLSLVAFGSSSFPVAFPLFWKQKSLLMKELKTPWV